MIDTRTTRLSIHRAHAISRVSALGLVAVLFAVAGFAMWGAISTRSAAQEARTLFTLDESYQSARYWLAKEDLARLQYRVAPRASLRERYEEASSQFERSIISTDAFGDSSLQRASRELIASHGRYVAAVDVGFATVDRKDFTVYAALARTLIVPRYDRLERRIAADDDTIHRTAVTAFERLDATQQAVTNTTRVVCAFGIMLLIIFLLIVRSYKRRLDDALQSELEHAAEMGFKDNLTGLGNHRAYQEAIAREISRAERTGEPLTLALVDVDEFAFVNDLHGHAHGDLVLTLLARLLDEFRAGDLAFRLGGDEFALLLTNTGLADAATVMQRLRMSAPKRLLGSTVSIGLAEFGAARNTSTTLKEQADAALAEAKRRGRNAVVSVDELEDVDAIVSTRKVRALRQLLIDGSMEIAFQPIWDLKSGGILGLEALARLPAGCALDGTQEAFDIAERIGRAHDLDRICRDAVLARTRELPADVLLFLNVSPQSLDHDAFGGDALVRAVRAAGLEPHRVVLELTERSLARPQVVIREARRLQTLGFRLALDDTGAGNAGLEMLSRICVDFVKIDRGVIVSAMTDRGARGVLAGILAIAQQTEAYVIAEGLETSEMFDLVKNASQWLGYSFGVHAVQGYLFGTPSFDVSVATRYPSEAPRLTGFTVPSVRAV